MKRYAEAVFRHWAIVIVPIILLPLGAFVLMSPKPAIYGTTNIWVDPQSIQQLSYVNPNIAPADNLVSYINQLLLSKSFDEQVAKHSPLYWRSLSARPSPLDAAAGDLDKNAQASTSGPTFVTISYAAPTQDIAVEVTQSILQEVTLQIRHFDEQQAHKNYVYQKQQLSTARSAYSHAAQKLNKYIRAHHIPTAQLAMRQLSNPELAGLYQTVQSAQKDEDSAVQQLATLSTPNPSQGGLRVIDAPSSTVVLTSKKKRLMGLAVPLILAILISGAFIVVRVALDRSLRYADEVSEHLGLPVLAVVPYSVKLADGNDTKHRSHRLSAAQET